MHAQYAGSVRKGQPVRLFGIAGRETLVGSAYEYRPAESAELPEMRQQLPVLRCGLREAEPRVEYPPPHPAALRPCGKRVEIVLYGGDYALGIVAERVHGTRVPSLVHRDILQAERADKRKHLRIILSRGNIVYDEVACQGIYPADDLGPRGVYRYTHRTVQSRQHRLEPRPFGLEIHVRRTRPRGHGTEIDDVGSPGNPRSHAGYGLGGRGPARRPERVRRQVDYTHYPEHRPTAEASPQRHTA